MHLVTIGEAKLRLPDLLGEAANGEDVVIASDTGSRFKLVLLDRPKPSPRFGSAKGLITISDDFDEPLEDFAEYMQ